jgi:integrase
MQKVKYFQERQRSTGPVYVVNPPAYVKQLTGAEYQQFTDKEQAIAAALRVSQQFQDARRGKSGKVYADDALVEGLIQHYLTTIEFADLKPNSKRVYRMAFRTAIHFRVGNSNKPFGQIYAKNVTALMVDDFYQQLSVDQTLHCANYTTRVLRRVWNVGLRHSKVLSNPFVQKRMKSTPSRDVVWERDEVKLAIHTADSMGMYNLGTMMMMCYHLCQRPGDMRQLLWSNYDGETFRFKQEKTGTDMELDASPDLAARLTTYKSQNPEDLIVPNDSTGRGHNRSSYNTNLSRIRDKCGLSSNLKMADLRRTGATEMAESNCTEDELRAVTGHKSRGMLETYVRPTRRMARSGINKRFAT